MTKYRNYRTRGGDDLDVMVKVMVMFSKCMRDMVKYLAKQDKTVLQDPQYMLLMNPDGDEFTSLQDMPKAIAILEQIFDRHFPEPY